MTVVAHDGRDGQLTSTSGALTFRTGDFFAGDDRERMRITPDGKVGIGITNPDATLDVAGAVRATGGFRFSDGTTLDAAGDVNTSTQFKIGGTTVLLVNSGGNNTSVGPDAGSANKGSFNTYVGKSAGFPVQNEHHNTFVGAFAGSSTGTGDTNQAANLNTFVGSEAGLSNSTGARNTALGAVADVGTNLTNATAIGALAEVTQ
jgi:hypothetical protein